MREAAHGDREELGNWASATLVASQRVSRQSKSLRHFCLREPELAADTPQLAAGHVARRLLRLCTRAITNPVLVVAIVVGAEEPPPAAGWRGARWGMGPKEALRALKGVARESRQPALSGTAGLLGLLEVPHLSIEGVEFHGTLFFKNERLARVRLQADYRGDALRIASPRVQAWLVREYGPPSRDVRRGIATEPTRELRWERGRTIIDFMEITLPATGRVHALILSYFEAEGLTGRVH